MAERNYTIGRGGKRIKIDTQATREKREELRKLELENYQVEVPTPKGSGLMQEQIQNMADLMVALYKETQNLISASGKMIDDILIGFETVDSMGGGGGSSGGRIEVNDIRVSTKKTALGGGGSSGGRVDNEDEEKIAAFGGGGASGGRF